MSGKNEKHCEFYIRFVDPSFFFDSITCTSLYLCRKASSCYTKLDAGVMKAEALSSVIKNLKDLKGESHGNIHSTSPQRGDSLGEGVCVRDRCTCIYLLRG